MKNLTDDPLWPFEPELPEHDSVDNYDLNCSEIKQAKLTDKKLRT